MRPNLRQEDRYNRQVLLPQIGVQGQFRLSSARVLLIGCGALGSVLADLLARAGVGMLRIVDRDLVELTNLQRQVLFDEKDAEGELPKAIAAARRLAAVNSLVQIEPLVNDANAGNIEEFAGIVDDARVDLILDGTDNVATRYLLNDVAVKHQIPWVYGGCVGTVGRVLAVWPGKSACLRCVFPDPPRADELPTCDIAGVLGPAASAVASMQATMAMRLLVGGASAVSNMPGLLTMDVWKGEFRSLASHPPQPDCPCCKRHEFPFLSTPGGDFTTTLCGRNAVQIIAPRKTLNLDLAADRLKNAGRVERTKFFVRCVLTDPADVSFTVFSDGRLLVHGTTDLLRARSLYARYIGT